MADHEKLDKTNMLRVIDLLNQEKSITKKAACEILNISYNTTRLKKLIDEFVKKEENTKRIRAKLKGTPLTSKEIQLIVEEYLAETPVSAISEMTFRSVALINKAVRELNIPLRKTDASYNNPFFIEDDAISEMYEKDDLVYAARYQCPALIEKKHSHKEGPVYTIYLLGKEQCYACQPYWELADLRKIQQTLGIKLTPRSGMLPSYNP